MYSGCVSPVLCRCVPIITMVEYNCMRVKFIWPFLSGCVLASIEVALVVAGVCANRYKIPDR